MKHIKKFNENSDDLGNVSNPDTIELSMDDVKKLHHNLGGRKSDDFMANYRWKEDQILVAEKGYQKTQTWDDNSIDIYNLYTKSDKYLYDLGYAILVNGEVKYLIGIYEPHGCSLNPKRGLVTAHGHESIVKLWLDDGEFEENYTR